MNISPYALPGLKHHYEFSKIQRSSIEEIEKVICDHFRVSSKQLKSCKRGKINVSNARQIAMTLSRDLTSLSLGDIGEYFNRDHTTVMHACRVIKNQMSIYPETRDLITFLSQKVL